MPEEIWRSFANNDKLSRRDPALRIAASRAKYPFSLPLGGEAAPGLAIELCPLAELELLRLRPLRSRARCMLAKLGCPPGENRLVQGPLPPERRDGNKILVLACGVIIIGSSLSSGSKGSISSEELLESSDPSMLMLPTELEAAVLSPWCQAVCITELGESRTIMELERGLFEGILMLFWVMVGDESGEDASGRVEWWRLVHARENSAPRDRRGSSEAGEAYVLRASSCGERGTRAAKWAGLGIGVSREGICSERPLARKSGRRGVLGLATCSSSLDMRAGSRNLGDGSRRGVLSDRDRAFVLGDCDCD